MYGGKAIEEDGTRTIIQSFSDVLSISFSGPLVTLNTESQILFFYAHGKAGLGPKLLGSFRGGRLEEFIPSHTLNDDDLKDPKIREQIARRLARYHNLDIPLSLKPLDHYRAFTEWYELFDTPAGRAKCVEYCETAGLSSDWVMKYDWKGKFNLIVRCSDRRNFKTGELAWMAATEKKIKTRYVMNNNDMKRDNCLIRDVPDEFGERVVLIDYEINSMNPRGMYVYDEACANA